MSVLRGRYLVLIMLIGVQLIAFNNCSSQRLNEQFGASQNQITSGSTIVPNWSINSIPTFIEGTASTFNLSSTLPAEVKKGGTFFVDTSGARLPAGMSLSESGVLSVNNPAVGTTLDVVFGYNEPN